MGGVRRHQDPGPEPFPWFPSSIYPQLVWISASLSRQLSSVLFDFLGSWVHSVLQLAQKVYAFFQRVTEEPSYYREERG